MRICGGTSYENHTLSEIKKDYKEINSRASKVISLMQKNAKIDLPIDIQSVFADIVGLAKRIKEEKRRNLLFLLNQKPSKSFATTLRRLGQTGTRLHLDVGRVWNSGGYHNKYDANTLGSFCYSELRDFCCWAMDLDNIGFELDKRFFNVQDGVGHPHKTEESILSKIFWLILVPLAVVVIGGLIFSS